ncbi:MAG: type VI secretion system baseplate subunit TssF [bacterium]
MEEALLDRYREELTFLRRMGMRFAKQHPRLARRLELSSGESPDPHVERLIESVAFLTARLQLDLKAELPEITSSLLSQVYPHFQAPVPSMAIAQILPDEGGAGLTTGEEVPVGTPLFVETSYQKRTCRFRTCFPVTMWPLTVTTTRFEAPNAFAFLNTPRFAKVRTVLRLELTTASEPISVLGPKNLRFYLNGDEALTGGLYELMSTGLMGVVSLPNGQPPARGSIPKMSRARPVGFGEGEEVLPTAPHGLRGFSLLQEYFALPEKFLFFDIEDIDSRGAGDKLELLFLFDRAPTRRLSVRNDTFALGCTPVVNLFRQVSEPVNTTGKASEYLVIPDARWERTTEIHSILGVTPSLTLEDDIPLYEPIFGHRHSLERTTVYWQASRRPSRIEETPGTDIWMSFVDRRLERRPPREEVLRVHTLCTNRDLATFLDQGEQLHVEEGPHAMVRLMTRPTLPVSPPMQGEALWRLVSHLSLSHTGLPDVPEALAEALREQLRVYAFTTNESLERQIQSIVEAKKETVALRADDQRWQGFVRVQRITVTVDEGRFSGISPILLGAVLRQYFGLHASINVFTQLALVSRQREGIWHLWPPTIPETSSANF